MTGEAFPLIVRDASETSVRPGAAVEAAGATAFEGVRVDGAGVTWQCLSHELRTPLNSMLMLSQLMREGKTGGLTSEQETYLEIIHRNGRNLAALLDDVVDLAAIEGGRLQARPIDVVAEARGAMAAVDALVNARSIPLIVDEREPWPTFAGDAGRFRRALTNLISRVVRTSPGGPIVLVPGKSTGGHLASVHLSDGSDGSVAGAGRGESRLAEASDQTVEQGHRFELGVVIAARFLRLMGGGVWATDLGDGRLRFTVVMPTMHAA